MIATDSQKRRVRAPLAAGVLAAVLLTGLIAGCATTPRAVLNVPGNYVADLTIPTVDGHPAASVVMCLDEPSAVFLETGVGGWGNLGYIDLDWNGTEYQATDMGGVTLTTPVLQPGCGLLTFGPDCCTVDDYLAIQATKIT